ncbi:hypothetical protein Zmor_006900 [Zophobas morio]|uniref:Uncharacterized protein n=1 Tax=Zophobas morio TaxID=2755281 RepID=A0AA38MNU6_9CUCU|nr:hypothetical protein Zmor_006900 [Zophobas morio]
MKVWVGKPNHRSRFRCYANHGFRIHRTLRVGCLRPRYPHLHGVPGHESPRSPYSGLPHRKALRLSPKEKPPLRSFSLNPPPPPSSTLMRVNNITNIPPLAYPPGFLALLATPKPATSREQMR